MKESGGGFGWYLLLIGAGLILAAVWFFTPARMVLGIWLSMSKIRRQEARMQRPGIYLPVATNLVLYCQSADDLGFTDMVGASMLPEPLPSLGSPWAYVRTNQAHVEYGGGFYHYGYGMQLDETASDAQSNVWNLYLQREGSTDKLLHHFVVPTAARLPAGTFISNSIAQYDRRLARSPNDLLLHKARIAFLAKYNREAIRPACLEAIKALPNNWWPRLTLALVETGQQRPLEASREFARFVESKPGYSRYLYLAYFYQLTDRPKEAADAVERAVSNPITDLDDDETNSECRGYTAGVYAYQHGYYQTANKLCDVLLPIKENGDYAKSALLALKSAAQSAMAGSGTNFIPDERVLGFKPYESIDVRVLLNK